MSAKGGLGRGLAALIPSRAPQVLDVDIEALQPNPTQVRSQFDEAKLEALAASIRRHGLLQPLVVRETPPSDQGGARYQIVAGERRWRAARMAGLKRVPVVVREASGSQVTELALVENIQRADLNPIEEASAYRRLVRVHGLTQEEIAARMGKSAPAISNALRLLSLPAAVQAVVISGTLSEGHARCLLGLPQGETVMVAAMETIIADKLSVRQAEALVARLRGLSEAEALALLKRTSPETPSDQRDEQQDPETAAIERRFEEALGTKVRLLRRGNGGRLVIYFYSEEELQGLYDALAQF
ncbi:MAG: ParB/RepB/Spo0J family partition protein [Bacteroidetes bacterium]|nr:ParB/RepB/Spo0J family partition protein [Bacteroidota bacterium]